MQVDAVAQIIAVCIGILEIIFFLNFLKIVLFVHRYVTF